MTVPFHEIRRQDTLKDSIRDHGLAFLVRGSNTFQSPRIICVVSLSKSRLLSSMRHASFADEMTPITTRHLLPRIFSKTTSTFNHLTGRFMFLLITLLRH